MTRRPWMAPLVAIGLLAAIAAPAVARNINAENAYVVHNLVSDQVGEADFTDPNLVNGWGIAAGPSTPWWVSDADTNVATIYNGNTGTPAALVVSVPGGPTGQVFNGDVADFVVTNGAVTNSSNFIFATEGGRVLGRAIGTTSAVVGADRSDVDANYKGLAIATNGGAQYLYATDFHNARVDVFDRTFGLQTWAGAFVDPGIPAGFAPFGIQAVTIDGESSIIVTYAKQDANAEDEVTGDGLGYVSQFGTDGSFWSRIASRGELNAPWGVAVAPSGVAASFGKFSGNLLVGNFGDGRITAYTFNADGWEAHGLLKGTNHRPLEIDGLWGIGFGNGAASGSKSVLYFAAGPDDEAHGLFGSVSVAGG